MPDDFIVHVNEYYVLNSVSVLQEDIPAVIFTATYVAVYS